MRQLHILARLLVVLSFLSIAANAKTLPVPPVSQGLSNWCWLAAGEMVFRYYGVPNINPAGAYQCGIAAAVFGGPCSYDCQMCNVGSGTVQRLRDMLIYYPQFVQQVARAATPGMAAKMVTSALSADRLVDEIDNGRPIIAGISPHSGFKPPGLSEHAVVIVGYEAAGPNLWVIVNDPFPYNAVGMPDPYTHSGGQGISPGRYAVTYESLVLNLAWQNSVLKIERQ